MTPTRYATAADCPECGRQQRPVVSARFARGPEPGDFTVCVGCATILVYVEGLHVRRASNDDLMGESVEGLVLLCGVVAQVVAYNIAANKAGA